MTKNSPNRIAEHRKKRGMTQQQLADALNVHWMTVSKLERGKMQLTEDWLARIALTLKVPFPDLVTSVRSHHEIMVLGKIENGVDMVHDYDGGSYVDMVDEGSIDLVSSWFIVKGRDLEPFYYEGDAIRFTYYWDDGWPYLEGRLGHISFDLDENSEQDVLAIIDKYLGDGLFNLRSVKGIRFERVKVNQVGIVTGLMIKGPQYPDDHQKK